MCGDSPLDIIGIARVEGIIRTAEDVGVEWHRNIISKNQDFSKISLHQYFSQIPRQFLLDIVLFFITLSLFLYYNTIFYE